MRQSSRVLLAGALLAAAGCGSAPREASVLDREVTRQYVAVTYAEGDTRGVHITRDRLVSTTQITVPRQHVWNSLPDAFEAAGLPLPTLDAARGLAAVQNFRVSGRIGDDRISTFFDCGAGPAGLYADLRRIVIEMMVAVPRTTDATKTRVELRATALAHATEGAAASAAECSSTGALEARVAHALQLYAQLAASRE